MQRGRSYNDGTEGKKEEAGIHDQDQCRVGYTCAGECPVRAIRIVDGQDEVVAER
jgi:NAD-dependent dihydropyrimidine dehydrogenase PreA subunit